MQPLPLLTPSSSHPFVPTATSSIPQGLAESNSQTGRTKRHSARSAPGHTPAASAPRLLEAAVLSRKYKTEVCRLWIEKGWCPFGDYCLVRHAGITSEISDNFSLLIVTESFEPGNNRRITNHCHAKHFAGIMFATMVESASSSMHCLFSGRDPSVSALHMTPSQKQQQNPWSHPLNCIHANGFHISDCPPLRIFAAAMMSVYQTLSAGLYQKTWTRIICNTIRSSSPNLSVTPLPVT